MNTHAEMLADAINGRDEDSLYLGAFAQPDGSLLVEVVDFATNDRRTLRLSVLEEVVR